MSRLAESTSLAVYETGVTVLIEEALLADDSSIWGRDVLRERERQWFGRPLVLIPELEEELESEEV